MFCRFCGANIPDDSAFCPKCGQKVASTGSAPTEIIQPTSGGGLLAAATQPSGGIRPKQVDEILAELDALAGLAEVKVKIRELAELIKLQMQRQKQGESVKLPVVHYIFTGNPGTGKTTVVRMLGGVFKALGLLPGDHVVETDRSGLVAGYVGQTAIKTREMIDKAIGGILLIDEAYTLGGRDGLKDTFGQEAIDTLLKRMEDDRGKFIVIVAGYKQEMDAFVNSNPGLRSRFTQTIHFEDYNPDELFAIFSVCAKKQGYTLSPQAAERAKLAIKDIYNMRGRDFANGRTMRKLFEDSLRRQTSRIAGIPAAQQTAEALSLLLPEDIAGVQSQAAAVSPPSGEPRMFIHVCSYCGDESSGDINRQFCPVCGEAYDGAKHTCPVCGCVTTKTTCPKCRGSYTCVKCGITVTAPVCPTCGAILDKALAAMQTGAQTEVIQPQSGGDAASVEAVLAELDALPGLDEAKKAVREIAATLNVQAERARMGLGGSATPMHFVFTGKPTSAMLIVAGILGKLFKAMGLPIGGNVVEAGKPELLAQYVGQTAPKVSAKCDEAMGGILLIYEAHELSGDGGYMDFGREAIDTLLKRMEDDRGKFAVIVTGEKGSMDKWFAANPGLPSRFTQTINF